MELRDWEALLNRELKKAGFSPTWAKPALAWQVFRRLLAEPLDDDVGTFITGFVDRRRGDLPKYVLRFARHAERDVSNSRLLVLELRTGHAVPMVGRDFHVGHELDDGACFLAMEELLDAAYAEGNFHAGLDNPGPWRAEVYIDDISEVRSRPPTRVSSRRWRP